jgi:hypothetical protein
MRILKRRAVPAIAGVAAILLASANAPSAWSDQSSDLATAVDAVRATAGCPPIQPDPLATRVAQMANQESTDYINNRTFQVPFTDPMPALTTLGFTGSKARLLAGYAHSERESIHGTVLQAVGTRVFSGCPYTGYGASTLQENDYVLTAFVLIGP